VARHLPSAYLTGYVLDLLCRRCAALSDVAGTAVFSSLIPSQRRVSRHGISEGQHVTIAEEASGVGSYYGDAGASGKGGVGRGVDEEVRFQGKDADRGPIA
jgi:hypothetical protein